MAIPNKPGWWNISATREPRWRLFDYNQDQILSFWVWTKTTLVTTRRHVVLHKYYSTHDKSKFFGTVNHWPPDVERKYLLELKRARGSINIDNIDKTIEKDFIPLFSLIGKF